MACPATADPGLPARRRVSSNPPAGLGAISGPWVATTTPRALIQNVRETARTKLPWVRSRYDVPPAVG